MTGLLALTVSGCGGQGSTAGGTDQSAWKKITLSADRPLDSAQAKSEIEILTSRLNKAGVRAEVHEDPSGRLRVAADVGDVDSIRTLLTSSGRLSFREVVQQAAATPPPGAAGPSPTRAEPTASAGPTVGAGGGGVELPAPPSGVVAEFTALNCPAGALTVPPDTDWAVACDLQDTTKYLLAPAAVTGADIAEAKAENPQTSNSTGQPVVNVHFTPSGQVKFTTLTEQTVGRQVAIVLDDVVESAPTINQRIAGDAQIAGNFDSAAASHLAAILSSGALAVPLHITSTTG